MRQELKRLLYTFAHQGNFAMPDVDTNYKYVLEFRLFKLLFLIVDLKLRGFFERTLCPKVRHETN